MWRGGGGRVSGGGGGGGKQNVSHLYLLLSHTHSSPSTREVGLQTAVVARLKMIIIIMYKQNKKHHFSSHNSPGDFERGEGWGGGGVG